MAFFENDLIYICFEQRSRKGEVKLVWMERFCFDLKTGKCGEDYDSEAIYLDSNSGPIADDYVSWASFLTSLYTHFLIYK